MTLSAGRRLGAYEILAPLGAGGMGEVYVAKDLRLDRKVALKTLPERFHQDPVAFARFEREAKALAALNHPGILGIFDFGSQDGVLYAVTELLEGKTLRMVMGNGPMPPRRAAELCAQAALALAAAHDRGLVHRDLKPENLFLTLDGLVKILDFGLARSEGRAPGQDLTTESLDLPLTMEGTVLGTIGYMSPEQARGEPADARSDLFALGVVLFEMVHGKRPFGGASGIEVLNAILKEDPPALSRGRVTPALERTLLHCLEKEPGRRFQNARDLAFALGQAEPGSGVELPRPGRAGSLRLLGTAALVAALAAVSGYLGGIRRTPALPTFTLLTQGRGTVSAARFVPGTREIVYSASWNGQGEKWYARRLDQSGLREVPGGNGPLLAVAGDGLGLGQAGAFLSHGQVSGRLYSLALDGGSPRDWVDDAWSADKSEHPGDIACVLGRYGNTIRLEWPIGHILVKSVQPMRWVRIRGDRLALFQETKGTVEGGEVRVLDREGNSRTLATLDGVTGLAWGPDGKEVWASTYHQGQSRFLAIGLGGRQRVLLQHAGRLELQDVAADGSLLAALHAYQRHTYGRRAFESVDRDLGWLEAQATMSLTADGSQVLLVNLQEWSIATGHIYLRPMDGEAPRVLEVDSDFAPSLSLDGRWVVALKRAGGTQVELVPTGRGLTRRMSLPDFQSSDLQVAAMSDGNRAVVWGSRRGAPLEFYMADLASGSLRPLAQGAGHSPFLFQNLLSPDGRWVAGIDLGQMDTDQITLQTLPVDGGKPGPSIRISAAEAVSGWSADSAGILVWDRNRLPAVLERLDLASGKRRPVLKVSPPDPAGVAGVQGILVAQDGRTYAYNVVSKLSDLFLIQGLR